MLSGDIDIPTREKLEQALRQWQTSFSSATCHALTPDASLRRYFRIVFPSGQAPQREGKEIASVVAMLFDSLSGPGAGGNVHVNSFEAYVKLSDFFGRAHVKVPTIFGAVEDPAVIFLEDLGDLLLAQFLLGAQSSSRPLAAYYQEAIEFILAIQRIPPEPHFFPYQRRFTGEIYLREMRELLDFVLAPLERFTAMQVAAVESAFSHLVSELVLMPEVLVHRDVHSWNLMVDQRGDLRVIDFQDALLGPRAYDLAGLLNDRDTDSALGSDLYQQLLSLFRERSGLGAVFDYEYDRVLLQRDLKVAGRFEKLVTTRGLKSYGKWVPGTLCRIGRTLERIVTQDSRYGDLLQILVELLPDVRNGIRAV